MNVIVCKVSVIIAYSCRIDPGLDRREVVGFGFSVIIVKGGFRSAKSVPVTVNIHILNAVHISVRLYCLQHVYHISFNIFGRQLVIRLPDQSGGTQSLNLSNHCIYRIPVAF